MPRTKYSYQAMQQDLLAALKKAVWKEAACSPNAVSTVTNKVTQTDAEKDSESGKFVKPPTYTTFLSETYDAYKQGGDADTSTATFCGYAGMVAYRFKLPANYSSNISKVEIMLQSSRYLRSGLRVCLVLSDTPTPTMDWNVARGDNANAIVSEHSTPTTALEGVASWGVLNQQVSTLLESRPQDGKVTFKSTAYPALGTTTRYDYLFVYLSIEDYCDYWSMYSMTEPRYYSIEGSATVVGNGCTVTFQGTEVNDETDWRITKSAVGRSFYMPNCSVSVSTNRDAHIAANSEAFGNFWSLSSFEAVLILDSDAWENNSSFASRLLNYPNFPRKDALSRYYQCPQESGDWNVEVQDTGSFAVNPAKMQISTSTNHYVNNGGTASDTMNYSIIRTGTASMGIYVNADGTKGNNGCIYGYSMLKLKSTARVVPHGKTEYRRLLVHGSLSGNTDGTQGHPVETVINIWKCSACAVNGYWKIQAIGSLLSYQEMYTVSKKSISATVKGTGSWTSGITLSAKAEYIGTMPVPDGTEMEVELVNTVKAGDVLIFTPQIRNVPTDVSTFRYNISFDYIKIA